MKTNTIVNEVVTNRIEEIIGEQITEFKFENSYTRKPGTGFRNEIYIVNNKYYVIVFLNTDISFRDTRTGQFRHDITVVAYDEFQAKKKAFGDRVSRISKKTDIPWKIAKFVGHLDSDEEAIQVLEKLQSIKGNVPDHLKRELIVGIDRRIKALIEVLGQETWDQLYCVGQNQTQDLAKYLLGRESAYYWC